MWREAYNIISLNGGCIITGHNGYTALAQWFNSQPETEVLDALRSKARAAWHVGFAIPRGGW